MEGVETSLDRTLQPDFEENSTTTTTTLSPIKEVVDNGASCNQQLVQGTLSQDATIDDGKEHSTNLSGESCEKIEVCDKKDATTDGQGCESGNMQGDSSAGPLRSTEEGAAQSTDKLNASRGSELREGEVSEMETEPSRIETSGSANNLQPGQLAFIEPGDSNDAIEHRKRLAKTDNTSSTNDQPIQHDSSLNKDLASTSHDSSAPVPTHSVQTTSSLTKSEAARSQSSEKESFDANINAVQESVTDDIPAVSMSAERTSTMQSTHPVASHEPPSEASSQFASKVYSTSHLPDWDEKPATTCSGVDRDQPSYSVTKEKSSFDEREREERGEEGISEAQVDSLSCKESLEEEDTVRQDGQLPSSSATQTAATLSNSSVGVHEHVVTEMEQMPTEHTQQQCPSLQDHNTVPNAEEPHALSGAAVQQMHVDSGSSSAAVAATESIASVYPTQNHTPSPSHSHSHSNSYAPWFSLFPRELCETIQVAYVNNQAVLVESTLKQQQQIQQQQQQQQVQHVLVADSSGNQYIMAAPTSATTTQAAQYAYVTPDGQIIATAAGGGGAGAAGGQNQVIQQVTGMSYAVVGNTLVQVPQTQYIAVNASGQQFVVAGAGGQPNQQQQQQAAGVQYVAAVANGNTATSAQTAVQVAAAGQPQQQQPVVQAQQSQPQQQQQYVAVVEREGGGQMLIQVGVPPTASASAANQLTVAASGDAAGVNTVTAATAGTQQQYIVQTTGDQAAVSSLVAATQAQAQVQLAQAQAARQQEVAVTDGSSGNSTVSKTQYGIVNSDGSITIISEEDLAKYNVAIAGATNSNSPGVKAGSTAAAIAQAQAQAQAQQQQQQHAYASNSSIASLGAQTSSSASGSSRNIRGEVDGRVKVEIEVPDQYPQVYIKTEVEEEEERMEENVPTLASRQTDILNQTTPPAAVAVVGGSEGGVAGQVQNSDDVGAAAVLQTAESATIAGEDAANQQAATQVCKSNTIYIVMYCIYM